MLVGEIEAVGCSCAVSAGKHRRLGVFEAANRPGSTGCLEALIEVVGGPADRTLAVGFSESEHDEDVEALEFVEDLGAVLGEQVGEARRQTDAQHGSGATPLGQGIELLNLPE